MIKFTPEYLGGLIAGNCFGLSLGALLTDKYGLASWAILLIYFVVIPLSIVGASMAYRAQQKQLAK